MATRMLRQLFVAMAFLLATSSAGNFNTDVTITQGGSRGQILDGGQVLSLSLDNSSGSAFESKNRYLFGKFEMQIKLNPENYSAGTGSRLRLMSEGGKHDEIDMKFLGKSIGGPYTLQTNIYIRGVGNKEQDFHLWFDPSAAYHTYTILWNRGNIILYVDDIPIRVLNNSFRFPFPTRQPMKLFGSLFSSQYGPKQWWPTVKTDWTRAPFTVFYRNYNADACVVSASGVNSCNNGTANNQAWQTQGLDANERIKLASVQRNNMTYNYCTDFNFGRFRYRIPFECFLPRLLQPIL